MMKNNNEQTAGSEETLRKRAEEIAWRKAPRSPERLSPGDTQKIIHELRVHQIELEMQNEELRRTQLELDASRERYFNLYDMAPAGYCTLDNQGLVLEANLTAATMLGVTREALTREPISRFIVKEDQDIYYLLSKQLFKHGELQSCELRMAKKDGTQFWGQLAAARLQDADGGFVCHAILSDISARKRAEEALHEENSKQYRNLVEGTSDLVTRVDAVGRLLFVNHAILQICGLTREECIGRPAFDLVIPEDRDATRTAFQAWLESGNEIFKYENRLISTDSRGHYVSWSIRADHDEHGNIIGFSSTARDITERKLAEQALRESEQFLKETQVIANLGTYTLDIAADSWQSSDVLDKIFGINTDFDKSFAGWKAMIHPDWRKIMSDYFIQQVIGNKAEFDKEYKIIRQDDHAERWVHGIGKLKFNEQNQPVAMIGTIRDITERKQAEEALRAGEARLQKIIDNTHAGYFFVGLDGRYQRVNDSWLRMHGYDSPDEVIGRPFTLTQVDADLEAARKNMDSILAGDTIPSGEFSRRCRDGSIRYHTFSAHPVVEAGAIVGGEGFIIDATDRKRAEEEIKLKNDELLRINAEKDKFFSIIAHDLRSPFNSFLMLTKIMAQGSAHLTMDKIREIAAEMRDSATNIFRLLENLLQWAITQQGLMPFNPKMVKLRPIVDESLSTVMDAAGNKGINVTSNVPDDMVVFAENNMLQTVIRNLISNAVKFTPKGGKICVSAKVASANNIEISVKDSGIGMSRAILDNLFRIDVRTNRKGTENESGTGIGLLLCKEFVEEHGGKIRVESNPDKGSVFYFTIPCNAEPEKKDIIEDGVYEDEKAKTVKPLKILIAEDDEYSELLITLEVKKLGSDVLIAKNGFDAVEICRNNPELDLIMMDIEMPGMDGYEAVRLIRQFNKDVIIIAQTAYALTGDREKAIAAGCNDYIAKPFYKNALAELLKKHFKTRNLK